MGAVMSAAAPKAGSVWCRREKAASAERGAAPGPRELQRFEGRRGDAMKVVIVGGVAGGASCAARLRRLDERAEILMVERGPYVSFANCGLPYYVGGVIEHESDLLVANETVFREHFSVDCRTRCEAIGVSAGEQDGGASGPRDRRGDQRVLRQARPLAGGALGPPAASRHRPAGHLPGEDRAGLQRDP